MDYLFIPNKVNVLLEAGMRLLYYSPAHAGVMKMMLNGAVSFDALYAKTSYLMGGLDTQQIEELEYDGFGKFFLDPLLGYAFIQEWGIEAYSLTAIGREVLEQVTRTRKVEYIRHHRRGA